jgi:hypothetical protein
MDGLLEVGRFFGYITMKYLLPRKWRNFADPSSDLAGWVGLIEAVLMLSLMLFLLVRWYG